MLDGGFSYKNHRTVELKKFVDENTGAVKFIVHHSPFIIKFTPSVFCRF